MIIPSGAIVIAGGVVSFAVSRRLSGEARIFGGYFAGFAAGGLVAILFVSPEELQDEMQQRAVLTGLKELVCLAPAFGVGLAEIMRRRSQRQSETSDAGRARRPEKPDKSSP